MRVINADGSEAEMCGNGVRCAARWLDEAGEGDAIRFDTLAGIVETRVVAREPEYLVRVAMGSPRKAVESLPYIDDAWFVDLGNPHVVLLRKNVEVLELSMIANRLQTMPLFPNGTNVHIAAVEGDALRVRHWERGVGMTMACGTGAVACAVTAIDRVCLRRPSTSSCRAAGSWSSGMAARRFSLRDQPSASSTRKCGSRLARRAKSPTIGLAYCDAKGRIYFDEDSLPLADGGIVREPARDELIPAPPGVVPMILPGRRPLTDTGPASRRFALATILPAGYTRLLVPAYAKERGAPALPLFGYTFAAVVNDELYVAAMKTDESEDWRPRAFEEGELESILERRLETDPHNRVLRQVALCSREYGCFTAQNVFLERGEAALPVSPKCNARCVGCISEQEPEAELPSPQRRIADEMSGAELARVAIHHLERVDDGIVSFGQGCEGEPLLRSIAIAHAIETIRAARATGPSISIRTAACRPRSSDASMQASKPCASVSTRSGPPFMRRTTGRSGTRSTTSSSRLLWPCGAACA